MFPTMPVYLDQDHFPCNEILQAADSRLCCPWTPKTSCDQYPAAELDGLCKSQSREIQPVKGEIRPLKTGSEEWGQEHRL